VDRFKSNIKKHRWSLSTAKELRADLEKIKKRIEFDETSRNDPPQGKRTRPVSNSRTGRSTSANAAGPRAVNKIFDKARVVRVNARRWVDSRQARKQQKSVPHLPALVFFAVISFAAYHFFGDAGGNREIVPRGSPVRESNWKLRHDLYLDVLSESLIDRLSELPQLKVISRNSILSFVDQIPHMRISHLK